ncbi:hypothetical protein KDW49_22400 [Burkholderia dolosa]|uniref:hypothetical protein n=1 Tax=Burkholderia dolosa TaxID=152500 RepID=UPI001B9229D3|nr:hypothetical protein [Burkholderia dolosa]MBR8303463.1 hypothetical protein [Burkholderia dolosa]
MNEAFEQLLIQHPEARSTLAEWIAKEQAAFGALDFTSPQNVVRFRMRSASEVPTQEQKGRFAALQALSKLR